MRHPGDNAHFDPRDTDVLIVVQLTKDCFSSVPAVSALWRLNCPLPPSSSPTATRNFGSSRHIWPCSCLLQLLKMCCGVLWIQCSLSSTTIMSFYAICVHSTTRGLFEHPLLLIGLSFSPHHIEIPSTTLLLPQMNFKVIISSVRDKVGRQVQSNAQHEFILCLHNNLGCVSNGAIL